VTLRESRTQALPAPVRIAVQLPRGSLERGDRCGQRAERTLVRGELDHAFETELSLELAHRALRPIGLHLSQNLAQRHAGSLGRVPDLIERFPLFPLGIVLLPGEAVPLHIFEPRYRQMIAECLEEEREFGIVWLSDEGLKDIGCAAEVTEVLERMPDGRMNVLVEGTKPFRLDRRIDDMVYPAGDVEPLADVEAAPSPDLVAAARERYAEVVERVTDSRPPEDDLADLDAYGMAATIDIELAAKQKLLELRSEDQRLELVVQIFSEAMKKLDYVEEAGDRAKSNGHLGPGG
jgi:Lon protease-like protein